MSSSQPLLAGVIGDPISHSKSPVLHGHWLKTLGINGHYVPLHIKAGDFEDAVRALPKMGFQGANVTIPHKEAALKLADDVSERAQQIGAANTLVFKDGRILADNTDGYGFFENIKQACPSFDMAGKRVLCLGAGGAARAVVVTCVHHGATEVVIANRTLSRAEELVKLAPNALSAVGWHANLIEEIAPDLIVNSTSLGMVGQAPLEVDMDAIGPGMVVNHLVYAPLETELLKAAKSKGAAAVDGLGMLLHQAVPGFHAWFGVEPSVTPELRQALLA